jgi:hypothetical protein
LKNSVGGHIAPNLLRYTKAANWSFQTPLLRPNAESRSGHLIRADWRLIILEGEQLVSNGHVYFFHFSRSARTTRYHISDTELSFVSGQLTLTVATALARQVVPCCFA